MIYLVTNNTQLKEELSKDRYNRIGFCNAQMSLSALQSIDTIGFDIETLGFDPYTDKIICIQLGNAKHQFVVDVTSVDIQLYKDLLETKLLIGHNLKFDLRFLYHHRIVPTQIFDTFLAEKTLYLGIDTHHASLADCAVRYLNVVLDKAERENITGRFTQEFIVYSAKDVMYLHEIKEKQEALIKEKECPVSIQLDNKFVLVLAYIEYCGIKLDTEKWQERLNKNIVEAEAVIEELTQFLIDNGYNKYIETQRDMFSTKTKSKINWNSAAQVIKLFGDMGISTEVKVKGEIKHTTESAHLKKFVKEFPILETYIKYKELTKDIGTYGENWFKMINPESGRIHTSYKQLMNTGRLSSGGKNRKTGESYPNLQNIPSDEETRSCFVAEEGNVLIGCDYSGQEQIVLVNKCLDPNLLQFYDQGLGDMHSFVASKMYKELEGLTLDEIKSKHKDKRQNAKSAGFAINYGGQGVTIAENLGISIEDGDKIYDAYFEAFPGLKDYFEKAKKFGLDNGYVLISPITGKKSYVGNYEEFKKKSALMDKAWWDLFKKHKKGNTPTYQKMYEHKRYVSAMTGIIERMSLNYPIQGESAEITKLSCIYFWENYLVKNNLLFTVKFVNTIHDENLIECPESIADEVGEALKLSMEEAGKKFCKRVPLKAEPCIATYWKK